MKGEVSLHAHGIKGLLSPRQFEEKKGPLAKMGSEKYIPISIMAAKAIH